MPPAASPQDEKPFRPQHPLTLALIQRLRPPSHLPGDVEEVLDFASGSGRNSAALEKAGLHVVRIDDAAAASAAPFNGISGPFAAVISTHGLLHGAEATIAANLRAIAQSLKPGGTLYATFGSVRDARYGIGERLDRATYAPIEGDEAGIPHTFFERDALSALLATNFTIESLEEHVVDDVAGMWAHRDRPLANAVHWFAIATVSKTNRQTR